MRILSILLFCLLSIVPVNASAAFNRIAAVVNGTMITTYDLEKEMEPEQLRMKLDPKNPAHAEALQTLSRNVLDNMINGIIMTQEAQRLKVIVTESDVDAQLNQFMQQNKLTPEELQRQLQLQRLTEQSFRQRIHDTILRNRLLMTMVGRKVVITNEEIARYYEQHKAAFMNNQNVRLAMIVYPPSANAEDYAARIKAGSVRFEDVAREVSVGPRPQQGGDLGDMSWDDLNPVWRAQLEGLKSGEASGLLDLNGLKGQLKVLGLSDGEGKSLEEATPQIEAILREPKLQERFNEYTEQLRKRAVVEIRN